MPTFTINVVTAAGFGEANTDIAHFNSNINSTTLRTATSFTATDPTDNVQFLISGSGFTFDSNGTPQTGSITGFTLIFHGGTVFNSTFSPGLSAVSFVNANTQAAFDALIAPYAFNFNGGPGPDHFQAGNHNDIINGGGGNDTLAGGLGADHLNGGGGVNTLDYQDASGAVTISLLVHTGVGGEAAGDVFSNFQNVNGGSGNDKLTGDNGANILNGGRGNDALSGLGGIDTLTGGLGRDSMMGGAQRDIFDFNAVGETGKTLATRDVIRDFSHAQGDDIDLLTIDAKAGVIGNQAFTFIGQKAFSGIKGQLHYKFDGLTKTIVEGDIDGNKIADFQIELTGHNLLVQGDFIL